MLVPEKRSKGVKEPKNWDRHKSKLGVGIACHISAFGKNSKKQGATKADRVMEI